MGVYCPEGGISWSEDFPQESGPIAIFSQSGQIAYQFVGEGTQEGLRFNKVVSFGNASDIQAHEFLNYFAQDRRTEILGAYIEGLRDGRAFFAAAKGITGKKPLVVWKGGQTQSGARAALSHTSAMAGSQQIWKAMCRQTGIISVNSTAEFVLTVSALNSLPLPRSSNVAILGGAGGGSVTMTDIAEKEGLGVPVLAEETMRGLEEFVAVQGSSIKNPLDIVPYIVTGDNFMKLIDLIRDDSKADALIFNLPVAVLRRELGMEGYHRFIRLTVEAKDKLNKPLLIVMEKDWRKEVERVRQETKEWYRELNVATFPDIQLAARVLRNLKDYQEYLAACAG